MESPKSIAILEDDHRRRVEMFRVLDDRFFLNSVQFFRTAPELIAWLESNADGVLLLSLDHDLHDGDGDTDGAGTGRDVVDFLVARAASLPRFPVVIHTTNVVAESLERDLSEAGWPVHRVTPYGDLEWIERVWYPALKKALKIPPKMNPAPATNGGISQPRTTGTAR